MRFGGSTIILLSSLVASIVTILTPWIIRYNLYLFVVARTVEGITKVITREQNEICTKDTIKICTYNTYEDFQICEVPRIMDQMVTSQRQIETTRYLIERIVRWTSYNLSNFRFNHKQV